MKKLLLILLIVFNFVSLSAYGKDKCDSLFSLIFKIGVNDTPGACYEGAISPLYFQVVQFLSGKRALAVFHLGGVRKIVALDLHTNNKLSYFNDYKFVYKGNYQYITVINSVQTVPLFDVYSVHRKKLNLEKLIGEYVIIYDKSNKEANVFKINGYKVEGKNVKIIVNHRKEYLPLNKVLGILTVKKKRRKKNEEECLLTLVGKYKSLSLDKQILILDKICKTEDTSGSLVKINKAFYLNLEK